MVFSFRNCLVIYLTLLSANALSQHEHWKWKSFGTVDGLIHSEGYCLAEDSMGFIWVGTDEGLSRFDGTFFMNFKSIKGDATSLVDNRVRYLTVEPGGNLLIGTISGFSMYDYKRGKFFSHNFDNTAKGDEWNNIIRGFQCWPDGHIWIYTRCNVYDWDRSPNGFVQLDKSLLSTQGGWGSVTLPSEDPYKCWVSAPNSLALVDYRTKSMTAVQPAGDVFYPADVLAIMESSCKDRYGRIWYNSISHGSFYCYDPSTNYQRAFKQDTIEYGRRVPMSTMAIYADRNDRLWVSTWSAEPYVLDTLKMKRRHFQLKKRGMDEEPIQVIRAYLHARNGDLWVTGNFGLCVHSEAMESVRTAILPREEGAILPHDQDFHCLLADTVSGQFFIGAANGLFHYHDKEDRFSFHRYTHKPQAGAITELIWMGDRLLCGTYEGFYTFQPRSGKFNRWNSGNNELDQASIRGMAISGDELFVVSSKRKLFRYNLLNKKCEVYTHNPEDENSPLPFYSDKIVADHIGNIWMASHQGFSRFNIATRKFTHFRPEMEEVRKYQSNVWNMISDKDGQIWIGTFLGLLRIDPASMHIDTLIQNTGERNQVVFPFFADEDGSVWLNSPDDFLLCERGSTQLKPLTLTQPTNNIFGYIQGVLLPNKVRLFMSNYELLWYDHQKHQKSITISKPVVNWVATADTIITNNSNLIELNSDQNYFTFTFSSLTGAVHSNLEYQYMVAGVDETWVSVQKGNTASYNNLSGGDYWINVRVRANGSEWIYMAEPVHVAIALRYFETISFKLGLILILLLALAILFFWRRRTEHRITQEKAVASFIELTGELSFDEICKLLVTSMVGDLRYGVTALYLVSEDGSLQLKSRHFYKKNEKEFPAQVDGEKNATAITAFHKLNRAFLSLGYMHWDYVPVEMEGNLKAIVAFSGHRTSLALKGDRSAAEKLVTLFSAMLANYLAEDEMKRKEEMLAHINALLSESQLVSLRAQMNPHFVFNCLSSIQQCIVMKQYTEASTYLNKFSRLFRMVLNNSSRSLITLEEEINVLTLYLELEHMRFQEKFDYQIHVGDDVDIEEIMIPSMLLQPFVENALWHGLMHKENDRKLDIRFYMRDEEVFICEIDDNGIGRARAAEIKQQKSETKANESKGIKISVDRLNLISMQQGKHAVVFFEDKKDVAGNATGTLIRFELSAYLN